MSKPSDSMPSDPSTQPGDDSASAAAEARRRLLVWLERWEQPGRLPALRKLAPQLGVGLGSLNRAVLELVDEGLLAARRGSGTYLLRRLTPAPAVRVTPAVGAGPRVICLVPPVTDKIVHDMRDACTAVLRRAGLVVEFRDYQPLWEQPCRVLPSEADAVVLVNPNATPPIAPNPGQPILLLSTAPRVRVLPTEQFDEVTLDSVEGAAMAGRHLRALGCTSVAFLGVGRGNDLSQLGVTSSLRLEGFESGWGAPVEPAHILIGVGFGELTGASAAADFHALPTPPQAVFAASDELAVGFIKGALGLRRRAREHYQIIGFDGQEVGQKMPGGPLTTIAAPTQDMGETGARLLLERLANPARGPRRLELSCRLIAGRTARSPEASTSFTSTSEQSHDPDVTRVHLD